LQTADGALTLAGVKLPTEFAIGGLSRAGERLDQLRERISDEGKAIGDSIRLEAVKQIRQVHDLLAEGSPWALKRFLAQRDIAHGADDVAEQVNLLAQYAHRGGQWIKAWLQPVKDDWRGNTASDSDVRGQRLTQEAARLQDILQVWDRGNLPEIYRRLFSPTPTEVADFFVPRRQVLDTFNSAAQQWLRGHNCTIAVVGDTGSGRTSFIDYALHTTLEGIPTVRRSLNRLVGSEEHLAAELSALAGGDHIEKDLKRLKLRLRNRQDRVVAVVEHAEHLFLRSVSGLDTLRKFLWMVAETSDSVLWILSMNTHAWRFLDNVVGVGDTFSHILPLRPLTPSELESLIMTRHRVSGFRLVFDEDLHGIRRLRQVIEAILPGRDKDDDPQDLLRATYFERLHEVSRGNPMLGIYHWLRSVSQLEGDDDTLHVSHTHPIEINFLQDLDTEKLLALANLILHNGLSTSELAEIFRIDPEEAHAILVYLKGLHLLYVDPGAESHYRVHRVLCTAVIDQLSNHKML
jgi:hypothetical protein